MPFGKPCEPGCSCGKHKGRTFESRQVTQTGYYAENRDQIIRRVSSYNKQPEVRARRRAQALTWSRTYREKVGKDALNARARALYDPAKASARARKQKYGLTPERIADMIAEQDGCCHGCGAPLDFDIPRKVHVDHDHSCCPRSRTCGMCVRGLLCENCNIGIARFNHDPATMRRVADWLEAANARVAERLAEPPMQGELPLG